jgi:hypothetical protein
MEMINEHDMTKSMIDKMRSINLVREFVEPNQQGMNQTDGSEQQNAEQPAPKEIVILSNGEEQPVEGSIAGFWKADKESFMQTVSSDVRFTSFSITPKSGGGEGDVKMTGILDAYDIGFSMNKNASLGLVITTAPEGAQSSDIKLDDDVMKTLSALYKYYQNWYKDWSTKLNTENFTNVRNA